MTYEYHFNRGKEVEGIAIYNNDKGCYGLTWK